MDRIQEAVQIIEGIRDVMIILEDYPVKTIPVTVCIVLEAALEKAAVLLKATETQTDTEQGG